MSKKSPYGEYPPEQIFAFEATTYIIIAGTDAFNVKGKYFFDKKSAARFYNKLLVELTDQKTNGNPRQQKHAHRVLQNLRVQPLRIH
jgi:hypothetical protein